MENTISKNNKIYKYITIVLAVISIVLVIIAIKNRNTKANNESEDNTKYVLKIFLNGATKVDNNELSCVINNNGTCNVVLPNATRDGGEVLGYNTDYNAKEAIYHVNDSITLDSNKELYVISKKQVKLHIDTKKATYIEKNDLTCEVYNSEKCTLELPRYNIKGYTLLGYSLEEESYSIAGIPGSKYEINEDTTFYPIVNDDMDIVINVEKELIYKEKTPIDIEKGCGKTANKFIEVFDKIYSKYPLLLDNMSYGKIKILKIKTMFYYNSGAIAITSVYNRRTPMIIYGCERDFLDEEKRAKTEFITENRNQHQFEMTVIHELLHEFDFSYAKNHSGYLTDRDDVIKIHSEFQDEVREYMKKNPKDTDLSGIRNVESYGSGVTLYVNIKEYFATFMSVYYGKYVLQESYYKKFTFTDNEKLVFERMLCMARNNYDESNCK